MNVEIKDLTPNYRFGLGGNGAAHSRLPGFARHNIVARVSDANASDSPPPVTESTAGAPTVLSIEQMSSPPRPWKLSLYPAHLTLEPANYETPPFLVVREEVMKSATFMEGMRALGLTKPFKVTFKLPPEAAATLAEWIGKPVLGSFYLRRRYAWVLPVAVLWVLGSLPMAGDSASGAQAVAFDPVGLGLGVALVIAWAFAKWRPHPTLFLVDSIWFLVMAGQLGLEVSRGRGRGWLIMVALLLWMAVTGFKHFVRFRGTQLTRVK